MAEERIVNPERLTNFDRTQDELIRLLFFSVAVAGKTAKSIAIKTNGFFKHVSDAKEYLTSLYVKRMVRDALQVQRMGKYDTLYRFIRDLINFDLDLKTASVTELEQLHGVGSKTARMFLLHSRPNQRFAVLDTHVLKFLAEVFPDRKFPKATPSGKQYLEIEQTMLNFMDKLAPMVEESGAFELNISRGSIPLKKTPEGKFDIAAFDLDLWRLYSGNKDDYAS